MQSYIYFATFIFFKIYRTPHQDLDTMMLKKLSQQLNHPKLSQKNINSLEVAKIGLKMKKGSLQ